LSFSACFRSPISIVPMCRGFLLHPTHITSQTKATNFEETGAYQRVLGCPSTRQDHCHHATRKPAKFANLQRVRFASMCHPPLLNYSTARVPWHKERNYLHSHRHSHSHSHFSLSE
jgi:hypothetical protein